MATKKTTAVQTTGVTAPPRRFDDAGAAQDLAFEFSVRDGEGKYIGLGWRSEVKIVEAVAWQAMGVEGRRLWASKGMDDGRVMLARLVAPRPIQTFHDSDHHAPAAKAVRDFRGRLLAWLELEAGIGPDPTVTLNGEGAATIAFGVPNPNGGWEALELRLRHSPDMGEW